MIDTGTLKLTKRHIEKVVEALKSNRLSYGPMTDEFERKFSKIHKNKFGIMTNSGTSALHVALCAMKLLYKWKNEDEVIVPATTFVATYNVILHNNLKPVLVDIDGDLNIDPGLIEEAITKKTRAILPVHLLGKPAKMKEILKIAKKHKLKVIEDSCETMFVPGVGLGDVSCFSFYVAHLIVTGVGGMAITNNKKLADLIRSLIFHGRDNKYLTIDDDRIPTEELIRARFRFNYPGYSYRATEVEAALGLVELEGYRKMIKRRQANVKYLSKNLNFEFDNDYLKDHACMMFPYFTLGNRDTLIIFLEQMGIATRTIMPLISQPYIKKVKPDQFPVSEAVLDRGLLIGCHQDLTKKDLDYMIKTIKIYDQA